MVREKLTQVAGLLREASEMLEQSVSEGQGSSSVSGSSSGLAMSGSGREVAETLARARSMMQSISNAGLYRRLNRNERLRAAAAGFTKGHKKPICQK